MRIWAWIASVATLGTLGLAGFVMTYQTPPGNRVGMLYLSVFAMGSIGAILLGKFGSDLPYIELRMPRDYLPRRSNGKHSHKSRW